MSSPTYVKILRTSNNGHIVIETNAMAESDFMNEAIDAIAAALGHQSGDWEFALGYILPAVVEIACKLRGYKTEQVLEQRVLISSPTWPGDTWHTIGQSGSLDKAVKIE